MPLPISRTQLDKLGDRLAAESASSADFELLEQVLAAYDEVISRALEIIEPLGYRPTSRLKTSGTLIEKLQREHGMKLKGVQDIAGLRIVLSRDQDQDEVVGQLVSELERATDAQVRVVDRRANPSHGYRAVHLVAKVENLPVEVQVRTFLQDQWAQLFESLADRWGRQIRYGESPNPDPRPFVGAPRPGVVQLTRDIAVTIGELESFGAGLRRRRSQIEASESRANVRDSVLQQLRELEIRAAEEHALSLANLEALARLASDMDGGAT